GATGTRRQEDKAAVEYELLVKHPYMYTEEDIAFEVYAVLHDIPKGSRPKEREKFLSEQGPSAPPCVGVGELADHFIECDDPVAQVLQPMGVNLAVGLGDTRERAQASHEALARPRSHVQRTRPTPLQ